MRRPSPDAVRGFDRAVYVVAAGQLVNVFGAGLVYPFATVHFHLRIGIALSLAGAFVLVSAFAGVTNGLYTPASQAYIADLTEGKNRDRAYSLLKVFNNVGFGMGFVVGGLLYEWVQAAVFIADGMTSLVVAAVLFWLVPRVHAGQSGVTLRDSVGDWGRAITKRRVLWLATLNVGFAVMYAQMQTTVPVVAKETLGLSASQLGTLFILNPLTLVLFQIPVVDAISSWRRSRGLVVSVGFWAAAMAAVWLVYVFDLGPAPPGGHVMLSVGVALVGLHLVLRTIGEILHSPVSTSLMSDLGTDSERGSQLSLLVVAKRAGFGIGSFAGGLFFDYGLAAWLWPTLIGVGGVMVVGILLLERRLTPVENGVVVAD